jgi:hypothetical protein
MKKLSTLITLVLALLFSTTSFAVPLLNSNSTATATIFLDFDGHTVVYPFWNGGAPINCAAAPMTTTQITEAFNRTAEDFRPFEINVTTDSTVFLAAPVDQRVRIVVTPTSAWYQGVGGVAYVGSFTWGDDAPAFVFCDRLGPNSPKMVGECCSHESGHTLGLSHQSKFGADCNNPVEQYNSGEGAGEPGWAPIMGNSYYKNMSNWNNGPIPNGCTYMQDNLSIITSQNGFGYREDDYTELMDASATTLAAGNFIQEGIITTTTDRDAFKFSKTQNGNFYLTAIPFNVGVNYIGANLDIKIQLYNSAGALLNTYDPSSTMTVTIDTILNAGTYYIMVDGTGNLNIGEYGSLGAYTITGVNGALPIHSIALSGNNNNNRHNLNWNIIADEPIKEIDIEAADDAINYKKIATIAGSAIKFSYLPLQNNKVYYRLKVTSVINQSVYSNTVILNKINNTADNIFKVSTFINKEITINANVPYQYQLTDINGRILNKGNAVAGFNNINISNQPNGIYIIQLYSNNYRQTERIIKQ